MNRDIKLSFISGIFSKSITVLNQFISLPILISLLGIKGFGYYSVLIASVSWLSSAGTSLLPMVVGVISRNKTDDDTQAIKTVVFNALVVLFFISAFILVGYVIYAVSFDAFDRLKLYVLILTLSLMVCSLSDSVRQGLSETYINNIFLGMANLSSLILLYLYSLQEVSVGNAENVFVVISAVYGVQVLFKLLNLVFVLRNRFCARFNFKVALDMIITSKGYLALTLFYFINNGGVLLLISSYMGTEDAGRFALIQRLIVILTGFFIMLRQPIWPHICSMVHLGNKFKIKEYFLKYEKGVILFLVLSSVLFYFFGNLFFCTWVGEPITDNGLLTVLFSFYISSILYSQYLSIFYYGLEIYDKVSTFVMYEAILNISLVGGGLYFYNDLTLAILIIFSCNFIFSSLNTRRVVIMELNSVSFNKNEK